MYCCPARRRVVRRGGGRSGGGKVTAEVVQEPAIFVGGGGEGYGGPQRLLLKYGNRHGLIAGATGTGKTVTLQVLAEGFSAAGVPVFLSDVKGDLSGLCEAGSEGHKLHEALPNARRRSAGRSATAPFR